jgi:hypothetical protein
MPTDEERIFKVFSQTPFPFTFTFSEKMDAHYYLYFKLPILPPPFLLETGIIEAMRRQVAHALTTLSTYLSYSYNLPFLLFL